jgi:hypothetical protein
MLRGDINNKRRRQQPMPQRLQAIVLAHPRVKLPPYVLDGIAALVAQAQLDRGPADRVARERETRSTVGCIVSAMLDAGSTSENGALSREQVLFCLDLISSNLWSFYGVGLMSVQSFISYLFEGISELDSGVVQPYLQPIKISWRPPDGKFVKDAKTEAAVVCDVLAMIEATTVKLEKRLQRAAKQVARVLNKHRMSFQVGEVEWKTVLQWRRTFRHTDQFQLRSSILMFERCCSGNRGQELYDFEERVRGWSTDRNLFIPRCG